MDTQPGFAPSRMPRQSLDPLTLEVLRGLSRTPKRLSPRLLYDAHELVVVPPVPLAVASDVRIPT